MKRLFLGTFVVTSLTSLAVLGEPSIARADEPVVAPPTIDQCIDANTRAQNERRAGHLVNAHEALRMCAADTCPRVIRTDCTERLSEVERAQPTIVFEAKDIEGHDLVEVRVTVDGKPLANSLTGAALAVDPGKHVFALESAGFLGASKEYVIHEGEKSRLERVVFHREGETTTPPVATVIAPPAPTTPVQPPPPAQPVPSANDDSQHASWFSQNQKAIAIGTGVVGVVGIVVGSVFGANAKSTWNKAQNECASPTSCNDYPSALSDHDSASSSALVSTVSFIAGGVFLAGGAALFFTAPSSAASSPSTQESPPKTSSFQIAPSFGKSDASLFMRGTF